MLAIFWDFRTKSIARKMDKESCILSRAFCLEGGIAIQKLRVGSAVDGIVTNNNQILVLH